MSNQDFLKEWDDYAQARPGRSPILMPINISIDADGCLVRDRMRAPQVKALYKECMHKDIPGYMRDRPDEFGDPDAIFKDYVKYFAPIDGVQGPDIPSPLDLVIPRPVWMLFNLPSKSWKFSEAIQYSVENDRDDQLRNYEKICTMDDNNALLVSNRCLSNPEGLKYNLHISIFQAVDGSPMRTDIIIDPGTENTGGSGGDAGGGNQN